MTLLPLPDTISRAASTSLGNAVERSKQPSAVGNLTELLRSMLGAGSDMSGMPMTSMQTMFPQAREPVRFVSPGAAEVPQGSFQSSGERQRAELQAGLNNIAKFGKAGAEFLHQRKVRQMESDVTRLMGAFQGLEQAKATGDQSAIKQNMDIINDMFQDPKKIKSIQKAFDVKLLGDDKGKKSPEHQGLIAAIGKWKQGDKSTLNPIAEKFQKSFPVEQGISPQMLARVQAIKAGLIPNANKQLEAQTDLTKELIKFQGKEMDNASKQEIAKMIVDQRDRGVQAANMRALMQSRSRKEVAEIMGNARRYAADKQYKSVVDNPHWKVLKEKLKTDASNKALVDFVGKIDKRILDLRRQLDAAEKGSTLSWIFPDAKTKQLEGEIKAAQQIQSAVTSMAEKKFGIDLSEDSEGADDSGGAASGTDLNEEQMNKLEEFFGGVGAGDKGDEEDGNI